MTGNLEESRMLELLPVVKQVLFVHEMQMRLPLKIALQCSVHVPSAMYVSGQLEGFTYR